MERDVLEQLRDRQRGPCLTLTLPTHRTTPDNRQDPIRLANLVRTAQQRLRDELPPALAAELSGRLLGLVNDLPIQQNREGLALFVQQDLAQLVRLPFAPPERLTLGERFAVQELIDALNRTRDYLVLVIADQPSRLLRGADDRLDELIDPATFPYADPDHDGESLRTNDSAINTALLRDQHLRIYLREVDHRLATVIGNGQPTLIVVGVEKMLSLFHEVTQHTALIGATLTASAGRLKVAELETLIEPARRAALQREQEQALAALAHAIDRGRAAIGSRACRQAADLGRIDRLLVEQHAREATAEERSDGEPLRDGIDALIEQVRATGGSVLVLEDGALSGQRQVAAILRY